MIEYDKQFNRITATPVPNMLNFAGKYRSRALQDKTADEIIVIENKTIIEGKY